MLHTVFAPQLRYALALQQMQLAIAKPNFSKPAVENLIPVSSYSLSTQLVHSVNLYD